MQGKCRSLWEWKFLGWFHCNTGFIFSKILTNLKSISFFFNTFLCYNFKEKELGLAVRYD
jgi:hypothetical protein